MVLFVSDLAALGAFGAAAWQIAGGWYRFRASRSKRVEQLGPFEAISQALKAAAAKGDRATADWGRGAVASGHAHVVAGWNTLPADARAALVEDLLQVAVLTGQLSHIKAVREGRLRWSQLSGREQGEVLAALDSLTLEGLGAALKEAAPELAASWLWQVTETVPLLSEEPLLTEPCTAEAALLTKAFDKADKAVKAVLGAERDRQLSALTSVMGPLNALPVTTTLKELKTLLSDSLSAQLGPASLSLVAQELKDALGALAGSEDGGLAAGQEAKEAARKLEAQADSKVADERLTRQQAVAASARATEVAHIIQVASASSAWSPTAPVATKLALVELLLGELAAAKDGDAAIGSLVEAARKLVPKLPVAERASERIQTLLAALTGPQPTQPAKEEEAEGEANGDKEAAPPPAPPPASGPEAARELADLLATELKDQLPEEPEAKSGDEGVVSAVVRSLFSRVVVGNTPGGVLAAAAAGSAAVARDDIVKAVKADAAAKAEAQIKPALEKVESELPALRAKIASELLTSQLQEAEQPEGSMTTGQRLALATAYIKNVVLPGSGTGLASGAQRALGLLRPDTDASPLGPGAAATVAHVQQLSTQLTLATDLTIGLDMGPEIVALLDRLDAFSAEAKAAAEAGKAAPPPAIPNGHAAMNGENGENGTEESEGENHVGEEEPPKAPAKEEEQVERKWTASPQQWAKVQELVGTLLANGLVLLELPAVEMRKLSALKSAVEGCTINATGDALVFNRHLTALKDLSGQLGPVMMALEAKSGSATGERQEALNSLKASAVDSYKALQELLALEHNMRTNSVDSLNEVREIVYGLRLQRSSAVLESGLARLDGVKAKAEGVMGWVAALQGSEDAVSEVMVMEEQVDRVVAAVRVWADWVRLREAALGVTPASPVAEEEDAGLQLLPLEQLEELHGDDAEFIDMYAYMGGEDGGSDGSAADGEGNAAPSTRAQEGESEDAAARREAEVSAQLDKWHKEGCKLIARGQVAVVLLTGALDGTELRSTRDVGLPSTKSPLQLFAERLLKVQQLAAGIALGPGAGVMRPLDWYILTPNASLKALSQFLSQSAYFGLQPGQVHLVASDVSRPALSAELKVVMEAPGRMAKSPPCSGDVWAALQAAGQLQAIRQRGARVVEVHTLEDNLLARPADPMFLGCFHGYGLDSAAKVADPAALMHVYEGYAELVSTNRAAKAFSRLVPSIGTYAFSADWLKGAESLLRENPLALYRLSPAAPKTPASVKAAAASASTSNTVAYCMDRHLADWVTSSGIPDMKAGVVFVGVEEEFAPAVGAPPIYIPPSPTAATDGLLLLHTSWVEAAGGALEDEEEGVVEVSPLVSYAGEGLEGLVEGRVFEEAYDLDLQGYAPAAGKHVTLPHVALTVPLALAWLGLAAMKIVAKK